jgi:RNA polymerase sigma-70 factor, ECF subfamily
MSLSVRDHTARLVQKARDSNAPLAQQHAAFARLVERTQHLVFGLALARLRDVDEAKDAAQETFTTAWLRLPQLRDAFAFDGWLKTIAANTCARRRRPRTQKPEVLDLPASVEPDSRRLDYESLIASALATLPEGERHVTVLFFFLGYSQPEIARLLRLKPGTVGKRLFSARLRIRRMLPASVRREFVRSTPSHAFVDKVRRGLLDEYVGRYRFERRPDHIVSIIREGDALIGEGGGQRHLLVSIAEDSMVTSRYDGEGRFRRDAQGRITHFVYYEFGRRLGIARRMGDRAHSAITGAARASRHEAVRLDARTAGYDRL